MKPKQLVLAACPTAYIQKVRPFKGIYLDHVFYGIYEKIPSEYCARGVMLGCSKSALGAWYDAQKTVNKIIMDKLEA